MANQEEATLRRKAMLDAIRDNVDFHELAHQKMMLGPSFGSPSFSKDVFAKQFAAWAKGTRAETNVAFLNRLSGGEPNLTRKFDGTKYSDRDTDINSLMGKPKGVLGFDKLLDAQAENTTMYMIGGAVVGKELDLSSLMGAPEGTSAAKLEADNSRIEPDFSALSNAQFPRASSYVSNIKPYLNLRIGNFLYFVIANTADVPASQSSTLGQNFLNFTKIFQNNIRTEWKLTSNGSLGIDGTARAVGEQNNFKDWISENKSELSQAWMIRKLLLNTPDRVRDLSFEPTMTENLTDFLANQKSKLLSGPAAFRVAQSRNLDLQSFYIRQVANLFLTRPVDAKDRELFFREAKEAQAYSPNSLVLETTHEAIDFLAEILNQRG